MAYEVTLINGDGTGPELATASRKCLDATGVDIHWDVQEAGVDIMETAGTPIPDATLESVRRTKCALKAPITTPLSPCETIWPATSSGRPAALSNPKKTP